MRYIVAVKRKARDKLTEKVSDILNRVQGLETVGGDERFGRYQIEATPEALDELHRISFDLLNVEPVVVHQPQLFNSPRNR